MSLLTACQAVVAETGVGDVPATIIGNTDETAVQLKALAERSVMSLKGLYWEKMVREQTITTVASQQAYALPSDWDRYINETAWDATNYWPMRGSIDPSYWQSLKRGIVVTAIRRRYRLINGQINFFPTPSTNGDSLVLEYIINTPWVNGSTYRVIATADADTTVFPEHLLDLDLKWRWLRAKGLDYAEEKAEADSEISLAQAQDAPAPTVNYGLQSDITPTFWPNIPLVI